MDIILDFLPYLVIAIIAYKVGQHVQTFRIMNNLVKNPDGMIEMIGKIKEITASEQIGMPEDAHEVTADEVNGMVIAYDRHTGEFLAQADNLVTALELAAKRFPGKKFWHPTLTKDSQTA